MMESSVIIPVDIVLPPTTILRAGDITVMYERGSLRYVKAGSSEIIQMIYGALRLTDWDTLVPEIESEHIEEAADHFRVHYKAVYKKEIVHYEAWFTIEGFADNRIVFSMDGQSLSHFNTKRIGLCIHHPVKEMRNTQVTVGKAGENEAQYFYPDLISPHQPFSGFNSMKWTTETGFNVSVYMEGSLFETEDQRNWGDHSFKTYSPPLLPGFPEKMVANDILFQRITVKIDPSHLLPQTVKRDPVIQEEKIGFPKFSLGWPVKKVVCDKHIELLKRMSIDNYRVTLTMTQPDIKEKMLQAIDQIMALGAGIELVIFFSNDYKEECFSLSKLIAPVQAAINSLLVLKENSDVTPPEVFSFVCFLFKSEFPSIKLGYGTPKNFAELNRCPPIGLLFDFLQFSLSPQVHAFDTRTILENLQTLPDIIKTAKSFADDKPVYLSSLTFNSVYTKKVKDNRNHSWFQLYWYLKSIQESAELALIGLFELDDPESFLEAADPEQTPFFQTWLTIKAFDPFYVIRNSRQKKIESTALVLENTVGKRMIFMGPVEYSAAEHLNS